MEFLDGIASNLPSLIKAGVDVLVAFFAGIVDALRGIDTGALLKGIAGIGLLSAIMLALSATASLVPGAMVGILGMGAVVAEMALVLAAVGLLSETSRTFLAYRRRWKAFTGNRNGNRSVRWWNRRRIYERCVESVPANWS